MTASGYYSLRQHGYWVHRNHGNFLEAVTLVRFVVRLSLFLRLRYQRNVAWYHFRVNSSTSRFYSFSYFFYISKTQNIIKSKLLFFCQNYKNFWIINTFYLYFQIWTVIRYIIFNIALCTCFVISPLPPNLIIFIWKQSDWPSEIILVDNMRSTVVSLSSDHEIQ